MFIGRSVPIISKSPYASGRAVVVSSNTKSLRFNRTDGEFVKFGGEVGSEDTMDDLFLTGGSLSAWIYPTDLSDINRRYIAWKTTGANGWILELQATGGGHTSAPIRWTYDFSTTNLQAQYGANGTKLAINTWYHVAVVYDASEGLGFNNSRQSIYINGEPVTAFFVGDNPPVGTAQSDAGNDLGLGKQQGSGASARGWDGLIDEFALWDRCLTADEVLEIYNQKSLDLTISTGNYVSHGFLKGYWRMGDDAKDVWNPSSGDIVGLIENKADPYVIGSDIYGNGDAANTSSQVDGTANWVAANSMAMSSDSSVVKIGDRSLKFDADGNADAYASLYIHNLSSGWATAMAYDKLYQIQFWARGDSSTDTMDIGLTKTVSGEAVQFTIKTIPADDTWAQYTYYFIHHSGSTNGTKYLALKENGSNNNAVAYIDGITLKEVTGTPGLLRGFDVAGDIISSVP